ncbi:MAG: PIG-L family deacetylase [Chitinophagales bacterium]
MRNTIQILLILACLFLQWSDTQAQAPEKWTTSDIQHALKKLNVVGTALFVAAHPDDENQRVISYFANEKGLRTAYLSLTRGDGGQNLIGPEIRELLGVLRTNELVQARSVDGGEQMFSRANDFGYSKNPEETFATWNKEEVLGDVVWAMRKFRPDIVINRFNHDTKRKTHGHHTGSAILSVEAFDLVNDKTAYPEQLKHVEPWQPHRIFFNTSWWFYGSKEKFKEADKTNLVSFDAGVYYPLLGKSNTEIASEARSMHKCQGFGSTGDRGSMAEYLEFINGEKPADNDPLSGINTGWSRLKGGQTIGKILASVRDNFDANNPSMSVPKLLEAFKLIQKLEDNYWREVKTKDIKEVIKACLGMYLEAAASDYSATKGQSIELSMEAINRSDAPVTLKSVQYLPMNLDSSVNTKLEKNQSIEFTKTLKIPANMPSTTPYWLNKDASLGMYSVPDQTLRGLPNTPRQFRVKYVLDIAGTTIDYEMEVVFKKNDPVKGETYRPFEVIPPVSVALAEKVYLYPNDEAQTLKVVVKAGRKDAAGVVTIERPEGWTLKPEAFKYDLQQKGEEKTFDFQLIPPKNQSVGEITALAKMSGTNEPFSDEMVVMEYDHIPTQTILMPATSKVVRVDLKKKGEKIGYIMGAGDAIPESLEQIGYEVTLLEEKDMEAEKMAQFDAVIVGIRAFNTVDALKFKNKELMEYVKQGGTVMVQYNTSHRLVTKDIAPYPLTLSRDRVAVEESEVRFLKPEHPVLNTPNKITAADFDGWVQERGLYFPNEWDENFEAILSSNDPNEEPLDGGLLVAKYGEGYYIYSGYSWFRELPAGVAGAYRLFANLISIGK